MNNSLGRCACHEPTVKWCTRHGEPIKGLLPDDIVMDKWDLTNLIHVIDRERAEHFATVIRRFRSPKHAAS